MTKTLNATVLDVSRQKQRVEEPAAAVHCCSIFGVTEDVPEDALASLSARHPIAEFVVRYNPGRAGAEPQFPIMHGVRRLTRLGHERCRMGLEISGVGLNELLSASDAWLADRLAGVSSAHLVVRSDRFDASQVAEAVRRVLSVESCQRASLRVTRENLSMCRELAGIACLDLLWNYREEEPKPSKTSRRERSSAGYSVPWGHGGAQNEMGRQLAELLQATGQESLWVALDSGVHTAQGRLNLDRVSLALHQVGLLRMGQAVNG